MSKKSWPIVFSKVSYKIGQDFLNIRRLEPCFKKWSDPFCKPDSNPIILIFQRLREKSLILKEKAIVSGRIRIHLFLSVGSGSYFYKELDPDLVDLNPDPLLRK